MTQSFCRFGPFGARLPGLWLQFLGSNSKLDLRNVRLFYQVLSYLHLPILLILLYFDILVIFEDVWPFGYLSGRGILEGRQWGENLWKTGLGFLKPFWRFLALCFGWFVLDFSCSPLSWNRRNNSPNFLMSNRKFLFWSTPWWYFWCQSFVSRNFWECLNWVERRFWGHKAYLDGWFCSLHTPNSLNLKVTQIL